VRVFEASGQEAHGALGALDFPEPLFEAYGVPNTRRPRRVGAPGAWHQESELRMHGRCYPGKVPRRVAFERKAAIR
ncbi:MAG: hypothetical protein ACREQ5_29005, partial [Candidatus Dormibacteria bacterium]